MNFRHSTIAVFVSLCLSSGVAWAQVAPNECQRPRIDKVEIPNTVWQPGPEGIQIPIWPDDLTLALPDYGGNAEMIGNGSPLIGGRAWNWATYISRPTITVYPPKGENTGAALLVLPGGGYAAVAMDLEGTEICDRFTQDGLTCVILKYRVPQTWQRNESGVGQRPDILYALEDAQRAMGLLRQNADTYGIDADRIGVIGFSAGAHLAADLSNIFERTYNPVDAADEESSRPDFAIIMYPGRFLAERGVKTSLKLAEWMTINSEAPPTLLMHAMNDRTNDVRHSIAYALALNELGVQVDMRVYAKGCHAFGLRPTQDPITSEWPDEVLKWLTELGVL